MVLTCAVLGLATCRSSREKASQGLQEKGGDPILVPRRGFWRGPRQISWCWNCLRNSLGHQTTSREITNSWECGTFVTLRERGTCEHEPGRGQQPPALAPSLGEAPECQLMEKRARRCVWSLQSAHQMLTLMGWWPTPARPPPAAPLRLHLNHMLRGVGVRLSYSSAGCCFLEMVSP